MNILIENCLVLPMTAGAGEAQYFRATVGIAEGRIRMIDRDGSRTESFCRQWGADMQVIDGQGKLLMPGLINVHTHVAMTLMRGFADDLPLMPWLNDKIWPFEAKIDRDDVALGARLGIAEMLLSGTTTFVDMYWYEEAVAEIARETGIRAVLSPCFVDSRMEAFEKDLPATLERAAGCDRLTVRVAPHAPYSCSKENILRGVELCHRYGIGMHTHLAETQAEMEQVRKLHGLSPIRYFDQLGVFDLPTIAAHCVWVDDDDIAILRDKGVSAAHNPQSNMKLSSGVSPVERLLQNGVNVGIGTDGTSSNNDLDMWEEMRSCAFLQKLADNDPCTLPAYEVLKMATVNGAKAIGMEGELGVVEEGAIADVILIDIEKTHFYPRHNLVANLLYCGKAADVDTVIVDGRILVAGGKIVGVDLPALYAAMEKRVAEILCR